MSKCRVNKYLPGGRCGGDAGRSQLNPEFDSSLSRLIQQREQLDAAMKPVKAEPPELAKNSIKTMPSQAIAVVQKKSYGKDQDIELLLQGDYMDE